MTGSGAIRDRNSSGRMQLDRRAAEILALELKMLGKAYGVSVARIEVQILEPSAEPHWPRVEASSTESVYPAEERTADAMSRGHAGHQ